MAAPQNVTPALANMQNIEVDETFETDSTRGSIDDQLSAYSQSLTSSVTAYPVENGRRYHAYKGGDYYMPNDDTEQDRLDFVHHMLMLTTNKQHFHAPIKKDQLKRVLDVGTGTGIWAIEVADKYPDAEVLGNDLSPVQPQWLPPNLKFEVDDVEAPWTYSKPFDLIFARYLDGAISDWPTLVSNMYNNVRPGGWVELQGFDLHYRTDDGSVKPDAYITKFVETIEQGCAKIGKEFYTGPKLGDWLKNAGFKNVHVDLYKVPSGPWPKDKLMREIGTINLLQALDGMEGFSLRLFTGVLGWTAEEVNVFCAKVRQELKGKSIHPYILYYVAYGQKPEE
ncbi:Methyltransferase domain-containing protein [Lasiodiplodia theobromae]|uniref:Methyltransferase domain-containing protein n=1 Tax=Lasiodiplodia theobromae TaxID=45133 RepID=UPI0015C342FB|nr:Methyltransferase domain-containing protein [Lasiodiplodia theobromae]KAF4540124.1 Methyltransferase domain-containing protein [Lasiodiplodia theobromae]